MSTTNWVFVRYSHSTGTTLVHARYKITGGCDTGKNIIVAASYQVDTRHLQAHEFRQHRSDALRAADWFQQHSVEFVVIESTANYHPLFYRPEQTG